MLIYLVYKICFLCFVVLYCTLFVPVCLLSNAQEAPSLKKEISLFENNKIESVKDNGGTALEKSNDFTVSKVKTYFLVSTNDFIIALLSADVCYDGNKNQLGGLLAKYINPSKIKWGEEEAKTDQDNKWETQLASSIKETDTKIFATSGFSVVINEKEIFFIALNITETSKTPPLPKNSQEIKINLVTSQTTSIKKIPQNNNIVWLTKTVTLEDSVSSIKEFKKKLLAAQTIDCSAFITNDKKIGLAIKETAKDDKKKSIYWFFKIENIDKDPKLLFVETIEDCPSYFFQWGEKIIMIPTECDGGSKEVRRSTDIKQWNNKVELFYHLWGILKDMRDFTAATIGDDKKKVLLFTKKQSEEEKKIINLWMSDGNRVKELGVIVNEIEENVPIKIVVTDKDLFFLYQTPKGNDLKNIMLARHDDYLRTITDTLNTWDKTDKSIQDFCSTIDNQKKLCAANLPINGLVSFLSHEGNNDTNWKDKYLHLDVKLPKEKKSKVQNGFMFDGNGEGVKWPVGEDVNQLYDFKKYGFTLVAMVTFDKNLKSNEYNSVLGVFMNGKEKKNIGVLCANNGEWAVSEGNELKTKEANIPCEQNNVYMVAMILDNENIAVYIDWKILYDGKKDKIEIKNTEKVSYFYFGADITDSEKKIATESHVTVNKVLLYNRPFKSDEIENLKINNNDEVSQLQQNNEFDDVEDTNSNKNEPQEEEINSEKINGFSETLNTQLTIETNEEKGQFQSRQGESAISVNANITVLVLMFFAMFTLTERCV